MPLMSAQKIAISYPYSPTQAHSVTHTYRRSISIRQNDILYLLRVSRAKEKFHAQFQIGFIAPTWADDNGGRGVCLIRKLIYVCAEAYMYVFTYICICISISIYMFVYICISFRSFGLRIFSMLIYTYIY